jgi:hypothetical protein
MTQGLRLDRFEQLADFLEKLPDEKFDFSRWVGKWWKGAQDLSCGAPACGLGWAAVLFGKECGVHIVRQDGFPSPVIRLVGDAKSHARTAAEAMFGELSEYEFSTLFVPTDDRELEDGSHGPDECGQMTEGTTAKELAAHIRRFIAKKKEEQARELES